MALGALFISLLLLFIVGAVFLVNMPTQTAVTPETPPETPVVAAITDPIALKGQGLFQNNCAQCHAATAEKVVGPGLKGVAQRIPGNGWIYKWVHNSQAVIAAGDTYGNKIFNEYGKLAMQSFPDLSNEDIDAIMKYIEEAGK